MLREPVKFLLVDDREENLLDVSALLQREGLELLQARSGAEALELLLMHEVALAIVALRIPGMDGYEVAERMRGTERTRQVPILFLTDQGGDAQRRFRGDEAGGWIFFSRRSRPISSGARRSCFLSCIVSGRNWQPSGSNW